MFSFFIIRREHYIVLFLLVLFSWTLNSLNLLAYRFNCINNIKNMIVVNIKEKIT